MGRLGFAPVFLVPQTVTANGNSGTIKVPSGLDVLALYFNITAISGTSPTITFTINLIDPVSGLVVAALIATLALTATGETLVQISPYMTAVANKVAQSMVPLQMQIAWVVGGTTPSVTFAVNGEY